LYDDQTVMVPLCGVARYRLHRVPEGEVNG
jgi:hypothetical protein